MLRCTATSCEHNLNGFCSIEPSLNEDGICVDMTSEDEAEETDSN